MQEALRHYKRAAELMPHNARCARLPQRTRLAGTQGYVPECSLERGGLRNSGVLAVGLA